VFVFLTPANPSVHTPFIWYVHTVLGVTD